MSTFTLTGTYTLVHCCTCGVAFAITETYERERRRDHLNFYCPNGHPQHWPGKSDLEQLREQVAAEQRRVQWATEQAERNARALVSAEHRLRATRGVVTKIKRRVGKGVCPCCNRTFRDLARHMDGQHPEFAKVEGVSR